jgi:hypothetical protein
VHLARAEIVEGKQQKDLGRLESRHTSVEGGRRRRALRRRRWAGKGRTVAGFGFNTYINPRPFPFRF